MSQISSNNHLKAFILYWSATGNTEKVAKAIDAILARNNYDVKVERISETTIEDLYGYDLVFMGSPSYQFQPPEPVQRFVKNQMKLHGEQGNIKLCAPRISGKSAVIFCTYSGVHTGIREATPVGEYLGQFFEHIGFEVVKKLYVVGEFHGRENYSTQGKLGDIRGRPNQQDLAEVENSVIELIETLGSKINK